MSTKATIAAIEQPKTENTKTAKETKQNKTKLCKQVRTFKYGVLKTLRIPIAIDSVEKKEKFLKRFYIVSTFSIKYSKRGLQPKSV